jgi:hypothetical protein
MVYEIGHLFDWSDPNGRDAAAADFAKALIFGAQNPRDMASWLFGFSSNVKSIYACAGIIATGLGSRPAPQIPGVS